MRNQLVRIVACCVVVGLVTIGLVAIDAIPYHGAPNPAQDRSSYQILQVPALLVSELGENGASVEREYTIDNNSSLSKSVKVDGISSASASVYLMTRAARELGINDEFSLAPGEKVRIRLVIKVGGKEALVKESCNLTIRSLDGTEECHVLWLTVPVIADIRVTQLVFSRALRAGKKMSIDKKLTIARTVRGGRPAIQSPEIECACVDIEVQDVVLLEETEFEPGLWSQSWEAILSVKARSNDDTHLDCTITVGWKIHPLDEGVHIQVPMTDRPFIEGDWGEDIPAKTTRPLTDLLRLKR
jgi:hypothetical protein